MSILLWILALVVVIVATLIFGFRLGVGYLLNPNNWKISDSDYNKKK